MIPPSPHFKLVLKKRAISSHWNFKKKQVHLPKLYLKHLKQIAWLWTARICHCHREPRLWQIHQLDAPRRASSKIGEAETWSIPGSKFQMAYPFILSVYPSKFFQNPNWMRFCRYRENLHKFKLGTGLSRMRMGRYFRSLGLQLDVSNPESNIL